MSIATLCHRKTAGCRWTNRRCHTRRRACHGRRAAYPVGRVHGAATFYDDLAKTGGAAGTSVSARAQHVSQPMAASTLLMLSGHSASQLVPAAGTGWYRCKRCAALATATQRPRC